MKLPLDLSRRFLAALLMTGIVALLAAGCGGGVLAGAGMWAWISGNNTANSNGSYVALGAFAPGNLPGGRSAATRWRDSSGNLWLFGGYGYDGLSTSQDLLNDLWEYNGSQWAWMGGSSTGGAAGIYSTSPGVFSTSYMPGARQHALGWVNSAGTRWLYGGYGVDANGNTGFLNDLWQYKGGQWAWTSGSNVVNVQGVYGSLGTPSSATLPGARQGAAGWVDGSGNLWLFGGYGYDATGRLGFLDDLWKYSAGQWTWMAGSNAVNAKGSYGALGTGTTGNTPGGRHLAAYWRDSAGNFWLFGGYGSDSAGTGVTGTPGVGSALNDLWKYDPKASTWAWMGGSTLANAQGVYGTLSSTTSTNQPGARSDTAFCFDSLGNAWVFGGSGYDAKLAFGQLNDLWKYDGSNWTWEGGSNVVNVAGHYGTLGNAAASNVPGARAAASGWCKGSQPWLFGGDGLDGSGNRGALNDVWQFLP